jgi:hypothetical protein
LFIVIVAAVGAIATAIVFDIAIGIVHDGSCFQSSSLLLFVAGAANFRCSDKTLKHKS